MKALMRNKRQAAPNIAALSQKDVRPDAAALGLPPLVDASIDGMYQIATVSSLTGIPVPTLRVWESRHAVVQPMRNAGNVRLYRRADIERLSLVKSAVDAGHAISTVASLTDLQIKARFSDAPVRLAKAREACCRVLVFGAALATVLETAWRLRSDVRLQGSLPALPSLLALTSLTSSTSSKNLPVAEAGSLPSVDAVIVDAVVLSNALPAILRQLRAATKAAVVIVVYGLANRQALARLDADNVIALAAPTDPAQLARICQLALAVEPVPATPFSQMLMRWPAPRRYADAFLLQLSQMPSKVQCECPNHIADLVAKLNAFERYSLECESTNIKDAAMHAMMYSASGHCREFLEEVLRRLMVHEGIPEPRDRPAVDPQ